MCQELGVPLAHDKTEDPSSLCTFLGVELDSEAACSRLPEDKFLYLADLLWSSIQASKLTPKQLQLLVGTLPAGL